MNKSIDKNNRYEILDVIRGFASLYVVIHHSRLILWEGYSNGFLKHPEKYNIIDKILMYSFSTFRYGYEAVIIFIVLSGFVIHHKYLHSCKINDKIQKKFELGKYLKNRFKRIYPPFCFSIFLFFILDIILYLIYNISLPTYIDIYHIIGNLTFIMQPYFLIFGNNYSVWSLRVEWWIYMLYPIFYFINTKKVFMSYILILILFIIFSIIQIDNKIFLVEAIHYLPIWCLGAMIADINHSRIKSQITMLILMLAVFAVSIGNYFYFKKIDGLLFGVIVSVLIKILLDYDNYLAKIKYLKIAVFFKNISYFSYTLYIIHMPIQFFMATIYKKNHFNLLPHSSYLLFLGIIVPVFIAYISHFYVEKTSLKFLKFSSKHQSIF